MKALIAAACLTFATCAFASKPDPCIERMKAMKSATSKQRLDAYMKCLDIEVQRDTDQRVANAKNDKERVLATMGKPWRINRTVTPHGVREQWVYRTNEYVYFENNRLVAVQTHANPDEDQ